MLTLLDGGTAQRREKQKDETMEANSGDGRVDAYDFCRCAGGKH